MTMNPKDAFRVVKEMLSLSLTTPSETVDRLDFQTRLGAPEDGQRLDAFRRELADLGLESVVTDAFGDLLEMGTPPSAAALNGPVRVVVAKPVTDSVHLFLTIEGFRALLKSARQNRLPARLEVATDFERFESMTTEFVPWLSAVSHRGDGDLVGDTPRRLVRDLSTDLVPASATCWIYEREPTVGSEVWQTFLVAASNVLPFTLVNETWRGLTGVPTVMLKGERSVTLSVPFGDAVGFGRAAPLNDAAGWVHGKLDADVRHTLLTNELAREWREGTLWTGAPVEWLETALIQAKVTYGHHLRGLAKEALKTLTDLRKAVGDEVEKSASQTRELIGTLWRDFAVAVGALTVRLLALATPGASGLASALLLLGTATFLAYSFCLSAWLNKRFYQQSKNLRADWHHRLYGFLEPDEFRRLCSEPLQEVRQIYRRARLFVGLAYVVVGLLLLFIAVKSEFEQLFKLAGSVQ